MPDDNRPLFVGREKEIAQWQRVLADPRGQAVLVVGQPGMGKTLLVNEMARLAREHPEFECGSVRYEVTPNNSPYSIMESMIEDAFEAADSKEPFLSKGSKQQWQALFKAAGVIPVVGKQLEATAELIASLRRNPQRDTRDQFIERLQLISERMPDNGRAIFVIDPEKEMQAESDQDWAIVVRRLPDKIKLLFAQRSYDVLAKSFQFGGLGQNEQAVRIPDRELEVLSEEAVDELIRINAGETKQDELKLRHAVQKYGRHPYAVRAALDLIAAGTPIEDLPTDPTPEAIAAEQWNKIAQGGATGALGDKAVKLFRAYSVLEVAVPDDVVDVVGALAPSERTSLMEDSYLRTLLRAEGENRRIYHAILADQVREKLPQQEAEPYHRRAIAEFRNRLKTAKETDTAPDALSAERLAVHVGDAEGASAFVRCFVNECAGPLIRIGLLDTFINLTEAALAEAKDDLSSVTTLTGNLGLVYQTRGDLDRAEEMHRKALEINEKLGRLEGMAIQYGNLGLIYETRGDLDRAEEMHRKALEIDEKLGRLEGMATAYGNLGLIYQTRGDLDLAEEMYFKSLEINEKLGQPEGVANQYGNLGVIYKTRGDLDRAEEMHRKALEIDEKLGRLEGMAVQYGNFGLIYRRRGDLDRAEEMHRKALEIDEKLGRQQGMANDYAALGLVYQARGDLDLAEEMYRKALEIDEKLGRPEGMARLYGNLGGIYQARGDLDLAEEMHRKALEIDEKLGRLEGMAGHYGNLGLIYETRGDLDCAEEMYRKALEISEKLGQLEGMARQYIGLGAIYLVRGDLETVKRHWTEARRLFEQIGMVSEVQQTDAMLQTL